MRAVNCTLSDLAISTKAFICLLKILSDLVNFTEAFETHTSYKKLKTSDPKELVSKDKRLNTCLFNQSKDLTTNSYEFFSGCGSSLSNSESSSPTESEND